MIILKPHMFVLLTLLLVFPLFSCDEGPNVFVAGFEAIYFNSFEAKADTVGIFGNGGWAIQKVAPVGGDGQSLRVSGGCIAPHASIILPQLAEDGYYKLQCWGKNLAIGGAVELAIQGAEDNFLWVSVNDPEWRFIESADSLFCAANQRLVLSLNAGGIVYSAMLVDMIEVVRVP